MIVVGAMIVPLTPALSRKRARGSIESLRDVKVEAFRPILPGRTFPAMSHTDCNIPMFVYPVSAKQQQPLQLAHPGNGLDAWRRSAKQVACVNGEQQDNQHHKP